MLLPPSPTGLYWSIKGEVACASHVPDPASARWITDKWSPILAHFFGKRERRYRCQFCRRTPMAHKESESQDQSK